jgi:hypothetical protein
MRFFLPSLIVNKIWGKSIPEPSSSNDGEFLQYDLSSDSFIYATRGLFEIDVNGGLMPITDSVNDECYELDSDGDIQPKTA